MSVLITIAVLTAAGLMAIGTYGRLLRLRRQVINHWRDLNRLRRAGAPDAGGDDASGLHAAEAAYKGAAARYNQALETFPSNIVGGLAGFKRAETIQTGTRN